MAVCACTTTNLAERFVPPLAGRSTAQQATMATLLAAAVPGTQLQQLQLQSLLQRAAITTAICNSIMQLPQPVLMVCCCLPSICYVGREEQESVSCAARTFGTTQSCTECHTAARANIIAALACRMCRTNNRLLVAVFFPGVSIRPSCLQCDLPAPQQLRSCLCLHCACIGVAPADCVDAMVSKLKLFVQSLHQLTAVTPSYRLLARVQSRLLRLYR